MPAPGKILTRPDELAALLRESHRIAVLGIKSEAHADQPAHAVPRFLQQSGYEIVPVPTRDAGADEILGERTSDRVDAVPGPVDVVEVFVRPEEIPAHVDDLIAKRPRAVWFQLGIRNDEAAKKLAAAGIDVVQDRCMKIERTRLESELAAAP